MIKTSHILERRRGVSRGEFMKTYLVMLATIVSIAPLTCSAFLVHPTKVNDDIDPRFGSMNDGLTMLRFESYETHGYKQRHGYDREDEYMKEKRERYGYVWDGRTDSWDSQYYRED